MGARRSTSKPGITSIEPAGLSLPAMDRPSVAFAWFLDRMTVVFSGDEAVLACGYCGDLICAIEDGDTLRVLLNTALAHTCGA